MIRSFTLPRRILLLLGVSVLTACGVVGKGDSPVLLQIEPPSGSLGTSAVRAYQCVSDQLRGLVTFSDGTVNGFTARITWSSDNPAVVSVGANTGVLAPQAPGTATITATYYTLTASIEVEVSALTSAALSLQTLDQETYSPIGSSGFTIATNTSVAGRGPVLAAQKVALVASESADATSISVNRNVTGSTTFTLTDSTGAAVPASTVTTSKSATAYSLGPGSAPSPGPYTLTATLGACSSPLTISVPLNVANVSSLTLHPESDPTSGPALGFADSSGNPLPLMRRYGVERLGLIANFADGQTQDVSLSGQYTSSVPAVAAFDFASLNPSNFVDILTALNSTAAAGSSTNVYATFYDGTDVAGGPGVVSNTLAFTVGDGTLNSSSLSVQPSSGTVTATSTVDSAQFHAIGSFTVNGSPTLVMQDISRLSVFTSDNTNLAKVDTTASAYSGLAFPANVDTASNISGGMVNIGASIVTRDGTQTTISAPPAVLTVNPQPDAP